jgi:hypothetical protein
VGGSRHSDGREVILEGRSMVRSEERSGPGEKKDRKLFRCGRGRCSVLKRGQIGGVGEGLFGPPGSDLIPRANAPEKKNRD